MFYLETERGDLGALIYWQTQTREGPDLKVTTSNSSSYHE